MEWSCFCGSGAAWSSPKHALINFLLLSQHAPIDSRELPISLPTTLEIIHISFAITQSKNKW
jgi:hypothetical protein